MEKKYINIKDAAKILGVSPLTLRNWDKSGKLKALRHPMNNYRVYKKTDIEKVIEEIDAGLGPRKNRKREFRKVFIKHLKDEQ